MTNAKGYHSLGFVFPLHTHTNTQTMALQIYSFFVVIYAPLPPNIFEVSIGYKTQM